MRKPLETALRVLGFGSNLQFALVTLGGLGLILAFITGLLYVVGLFPWWINALLIISTLALSAGAFQAAASSWRTRNAKVYFAQLTVDHPVLLTDMDLAHGMARVQPHIDLVNRLPERLDFQMLAFTAKIGRRRSTSSGPRGVAVQGLGASFSGRTIDLPIRAGQRIDVALEYDVVYGPSSGDRYLIREHRKGLVLRGVVAADGTYATDGKYTATEPPLTEIIKGGRPK
jgi:hypothetical protein